MPKGIKRQKKAKEKDERLYKAGKLKGKTYQRLKDLRKDLSTRRKRTCLKAKTRIAGVGNCPAKAEVEDIQRHQLLQVPGHYTCTNCAASKAQESRDARYLP